MHRAGIAHTESTPVFGACELQILADDPKKRRIRRRIGEITLTVYAELWHVRNLPGYDDEMAGATRLADPGYATNRPADDCPAVATSRASPFPTSGESPLFPVRIPRLNHERVAEQIPADWILLLRKGCANPPLKRKRLVSSFHTNKGTAYFCGKTAG